MTTLPPPPPPPPPGARVPPPPSFGPPPAGPVEAKKPLYRRTWFIITAAIIAVIVVAGIAGGGDKKSKDEKVASGGSGTTEAPTTTRKAAATTTTRPKATTTTAPPTTTTTAPPTTTTTAPPTTTTTAPPTTTTTAPPTTTTAPPPPAPVMMDGHGDNVIPLSRPDGGGQATLVYAKHSGSANFVLQAGGDLLVNAIGGYEGVVLAGDDGDQLQITADGAWHIEFRSVKLAQPYGDPQLGGRGDNVVLYRGDGGVVAFHHEGEANFVVMQDGDLLVNEIGRYDGRVPIAGGPSLVAINADGPWTMAVTGS